SPLFTPPSPNPPRQPAKSSPARQPAAPLPREADAAEPADRPRREEAIPGPPHPTRDQQRQGALFSWTEARVTRIVPTPFPLSHRLGEERDPNCFLIPLLLMAMDPLTPHWKQPSHPDIQIVVPPASPSDFSTKSLSRIAVAPHGLFARFEFPPCTWTDRPTYATVQTAEGEHLNLNSDLVYINHSCEPSLRFDTSPASLSIFAGPQGLAPGDELTFFYPSTEWDMAQGFDCLCGARACRGYISGAKEMPREQLDGMWYVSYPLSRPRLRPLSARLPAGTSGASRNGHRWPRGVAGGACRHDGRLNAHICSLLARNSPDAARAPSQQPLRSAHSSGRGTGTGNGQATATATATEMEMEMGMEMEMESGGDGVAGGGEGAEHGLQRGFTSREMGGDTE
ncbi:hypothetical protein JHW43_001849, partial [Diplocarpon mali]